jgi:hypothetical protein
MLLGYLEDLRRNSTSLRHYRLLPKFQLLLYHLLEQPNKYQCES